MKRIAIFATVFLLAYVKAGAHRLDEYLQATLISVEKNQVHAQLRLVPGVMVSPAILRSIDTDDNGVISATEQRAYATRVLQDLSLTVDGDRLPLRLVSMKFPGLEEMRQGMGEIQFEFDADVPGGGGNRKLLFENHHQRLISAYLVNCLVPRDSDIRVTTQTRNYEQSSYGLNYTQATPNRVLPVSSAGAWAGGAVFLLLARLILVLRRPLPHRVIKTVL